MRTEKLVRLIVAAWLICVSASAVAHEFWVAPKTFRVGLGAQVEASLRVGQMMRGTDYPYLSSGIESFRVTTPGGTQDAVGMEGDLPALSYTAEEPGLHVIAYHSTANEVSYEDWGKFRNYLSHEGLEEFESVHEARGLPRTGFKEAYIRYARSLVQVGPVRKRDRDTARGLPLELVALDNPYAPGLDNLRVVLLREGKPLAGRQISVFRNDGQVTRSFVTSDALGEVRISVAKGGNFLLSAVDLQAVNEGEVVWRSHWATLTFGMPVALGDVHPLDPLSSIEIVRAIQVISSSGHATAATRVALVTLDEPDKETVLAWGSEKPLQRRAFSVLRNGPEVVEATVDLVAGKLLSWQPVPGVQPAIQSSEWAAAQRLTKADPRWVAAMRSRGYEDFSEIFCESLSAGFFDLPEERGRRLLKMPCYDRSNTETNIYGRPIEGLISVVDLYRGEVLRVIDTGPVPISAENPGFDEALLPESASSPHPVRNSAPEGWNFTIDQRMVEWQAWSFHLGFDQRFGPMLSLVTHMDGPLQRSVLYQGHLSEIFVPYMDPAEGWYSRSYMDAGEYGLGQLASPLAPGLDCPLNAVYMNATLVTPVGAPYTRERVMCLFERATTAPLWRHWEALTDVHTGRPATELVVRSIPSVGNYDYVVDWVFTEKGEIQVNIGATGIDAVKGVAVTRMDEPGAEEATRTGMLVAPNLVAVHHDHYFSLRLDLDVDGPVNRFVRERLASVSLPDDNPRRSLWQLEPVPMTKEGALSMRGGPELWRIENPGKSTDLGHRPSYQLHGTSNATSLLDKDDWPQRRAAFSAETLWITARRPGERFAAGRYPNQSAGGEGLTAYVDGQSLAETDIVAWYTMGFHHLTRPEDWPVLPTVWHQLKLRPYGFFIRNPDLGMHRESTVKLPKPQ